MENLKSVSYIILILIVGTVCWAIGYFNLGSNILSTWWKVPMLVWLVAVFLLVLEFSTNCILKLKEEEN
jgi:hypothetical protein